MESPWNLEGRTAFVTGSTRGIGWATARALARCGVRVALNGHSDPGLLDQRVAELGSEFGVECLGLPADMARPVEIRSCYQRIFQAWKRLDILVNNAGVLQDALLGMISDESIERVFSVNAISMVHNLQAAARLMGRRSSGSIINLSSIIGVRGNEGQTLYGASKSAIIGLTLSAAKELAPRGIRVNAVAPGLIDTDMTRALPPEKHRQLIAGIRMGRIGTPEDVAHVILFLASDLSAYLTGQVIGVDGGMTL